MATAEEIVANREARNRQLERDRQEQYEQENIRRIEGDTQRYKALQAFTAEVVSFILKWGEKYDYQGFELYRMEEWERFLGFLWHRRVVGEQQFACYVARGFLIRSDGVIARTVSGEEKCGYISALPYETLLYFHGALLYRTQNKEARDGLKALRRKFQENRLFDSQLQRDMRDSDDPRQYEPMDHG